ncbi:MAG: Rpn family recombination-promoting nuclease/putative transposase [Eubacterium sp.]|nr:Rpn family recombination-promoting nuclease/putative transposase [Eubacterium sp.]
MELTIRNHMIFSLVMRRENLARKCLERILGKKIRKHIETEKTEEIAAGTHGIRLDVYCENEEAVYNIEMQAYQMEDLPKRSRYYQDVMDMTLLEKGKSYDVLKKNIVIFICTYDPFGQGRHIYTFENCCLEDPEIWLKDESTKIFLNTKGMKNDIPKPLKLFLDYIETGKTTDEYTAELDKAVGEVRNDEKWREPIMTLEMLINDRLHAAVKEARSEGLAEGRTEGRAEGLVEGKAEGLTEGRFDEKKKTVIRMLNAGITEDMIQVATGLTSEEVDLIRKEYQEKETLSKM